AAGDGDGDAVGASDGAGGVVDPEVVTVELVVVEVRVAGGRPRLDHRGVSALGEVGTHGAGAVGGVPQHLKTGILLLEQGDARGAVGGVGRGQLDPGDDAGLR